MTSMLSCRVGVGIVVPAVIHDVERSDAVHHDGGGAQLAKRYPVAVIARNGDGMRGQVVANGRRDGHLRKRGTTRGVYNRQDDLPTHPSEKAEEGGEQQHHNRAATAGLPLDYVLRYNRRRVFQVFILVGALVFGHVIVQIVVAVIHLPAIGCSVGF